MLRATLYSLAFAAALLPAQQKTVATPADATKPTGSQPVEGVERPVPPGLMTFTATAYATKGNTVKGVQTQPGIVAGDRKLLPLGSTIRVTEAGKYSGMYVVTDVGTAIVGRRIDIYVADPEEARAFGKKEVQVELLKTGDDVKFKPATTNVIPKSALAPAQKKDAAAIPSDKVPADKPAVQQGRVVQAEQKAVEKREKAAGEEASVK